MSNIQYEIGLEIKTVELFPSVGEVETQINEFMQGFGFDEKLVTLTTLPLTLNSSRELTQAEQAQVISLALETYQEKFPSTKFSYIKQLPTRRKTSLYV